MKLYTIGFTKKSARTFFELLKWSGATHVVDVRLSNVSQLAGFAKRDDLEYLLDKVCAMGYIHLPELAPTKEMLDDYRKGHRDWCVYEDQFLSLMDERSIANMDIKKTIADGCLLCSEDKPHRCHRRLVAEYLQHHWGDLEIVHLT